MKKLSWKIIYPKKIETLLLTFSLLVYALYKWKFISFGIFYEELIYFHPNINDLSWSYIFNLPLNISHGHPPGFFILQKILSYITTVNNKTLHLIALINSLSFLTIFYFFIKKQLKPFQGPFIVITLAVTPLFLTHSTLWHPDIFVMTLALLATQCHLHKKSKTALLLFLIAFCIRETALAYPIAIISSSFIKKKKVDKNLLALTVLMPLALVLWHKLSTNQLLPNIEFSYRSQVTLASTIKLMQTFIEIIYSTFSTFLILSTGLVLSLRLISKLKKILHRRVAIFLLLTTPFFYSSTAKVKFLIDYLFSTSTAYTIGLVNIIDSLAFISIISGTFFLIKEFLKITEHTPDHRPTRVSSKVIFSYILVVEYLIFYLLYNDFNMRDFVPILPFILFTLFIVIKNIPSPLFYTITFVTISLSFARNQLSDQWKLLETESQYKTGQNIIKEIADTIKMDPQYNIPHHCLLNKDKHGKVYFTHPNYGFLEKLPKKDKPCSHYIKNQNLQQGVNIFKKHLILSKKFDNEIILLYHN